MLSSIHHIRQRWEIHVPQWEICIVQLLQSILLLVELLLGAIGPAGAGSDVAQVGGRAGYTAGGRPGQLAATKTAR